MIISNMGIQRLYNRNGGFAQYLYHQKGSTIVASNGVIGKVVEKIAKESYDGLPILSNSSDVYFKTNASGEIVQARIYEGRNPVCDFDWDHEHTNKSGEKFNKGIVHVQSFYKDSKGNWVRDNKNARYMSPEELEKYGQLLKIANPKVKLVPY